MHLEVTAIGEEVVELDARTGRGPRQASNSVFMASQIPSRSTWDTVACGPRASASDASTSLTKRPRTKPAMTSDSSASVRVTPVPSRREAKASSVPLSFGALEGHLLPAVVFTVSGE